MSQNVYSIGNLMIREGHRASIEGKNGSLKLQIGCSIHEKEISRHMQSRTNLCLYFKEGSFLSINYFNENELFDLYEFNWTAAEDKHYMKDIVDIESGGYWFGGPIIAQQKWPISHNSHHFAPYLPRDFLKVIIFRMLSLYLLIGMKLALFRYMSGP